MKIISIDDAQFGDEVINNTDFAKPKMNIKIHKVDLAVFDELTKLYDDTRANAINTVIEHLVYEFFKNDVTHFDTRYLLATEADKLNPELNEGNALEKSWLYEIAPDQHASHLVNQYFQYENAHTQEHDDVKRILTHKI
ncbi:hypothetical protein [Musicola paradisiaca]|uniref:Uncharacterized protein n=1 Tax=Musicola paradisiaca (strain Ech703) TaxID=579405 RepID=C6C8Z8_MUSP7|nr:hypothetical protein [Musicola paradisiaca]ACS86198.1 hypothetical protein Dd703_2416 [Musicola paradisiaca Ech703]